MVNIYTHGKNFIIDNTDYSIDSRLLGATINKWLRDAGELKSDDMTRCDEVGGYIIICPYGSLVDDDLLNFLRTFMIVNHLGHQFCGDLPTELFETIKANLPKSRSYTGKQQYGGTVNDSYEIEYGILPLCEVLNSFPFVETFSSCEGHIKNGSGTLYVLFTIEGEQKFKNFNNLVHVLDRAFDKVWDEIDVLRESILPQFLFNFGRWPGLEKVYFEIRIIYPEDLRETLFYAIRQVSKFIKEELT